MSIITAVIFEPDANDQNSGRIVQTMQAPEEALEATGRRWIEVPEYRINWDRTHWVHNLELEELPNPQPDLPFPPPPFNPGSGQ